MNSPWFEYDDLPPSPTVGSTASAWTPRDVGVGIGLVFLGIGGVIILAMSTAFLGDPLVDPGAALAVAFVTLAFSLWLAVIVLLLARRRGISPAALGLMRPRGVLWFWPIGTWLGGIGIVAAYALTVMLTAEATGSDLSRLIEGNPLQLTDANTWVTWTVLGIAVVIAAPLGEELFFRGLVFPVVHDRWGLVAGMAVSGALFALVHFEVSVVLPFWGIGMLFAWSYHRSGTLWTPVIAHAIFNGVSFAATIAGVTS